MTFLAVLHTFDAFTGLVFGNKNLLLKLYPFQNLLGNLDIATYFWISIASLFILFGITCAIAFHNPIEALINRTLAEVELEENPSDGMIESKANALEMISDTLTSNSVVLHSVKDNMDAVRFEVSTLKSRLDKMEKDVTKIAKLIKCPSCGGEILPEFKLCPFCGELLRSHIFIEASPLQQVPART